MLLPSRTKLAIEYWCLLLFMESHSWAKASELTISDEQSAQSGAEAGAILPVPKESFAAVTMLLAFAARKSKTPINTLKNFLPSFILLSLQFYRHSCNFKYSSSLNQFILLSLHINFIFTKQTLPLEVKWFFLRLRHHAEICTSVARCQTVDVFIPLAAAAALWLYYHFLQSVLGCEYLLVHDIAHHYDSEPDLQHRRFQSIFVKFRILSTLWDLLLGL